MAAPISAENGFAHPAPGPAPGRPPRPAPGPAPGAPPVPASPGDPTQALPAVPVTDAPAPVPAPRDAPAAPNVPDVPVPALALGPTAAPVPSYSAVASRAAKRTNPNEGDSRSVQPRTETRANPSARRGPTKAELEEEWRSNPANTVPTAWLTYPGAAPVHLPRIRAKILSALGFPTSTPRNSPADPIHRYVFGRSESI
ncbi:hypothetical protein LPJ56_005038, partial [Coemansia sp. RSA 2599]